MIIKQATIDDLEKIVELFDQYRVFYGCESDIEGAKKFLFDRFLNLQSIVFVAVDDAGKYIGFTQLYPSFSSVSMKKVYILNDLYVCTEYRKRKVGSLLLSTVLEYGKKMNAARITLTTEVTNTVAQSVYEKTGFSYDEENKVYHCFL